MGVLKSALAVAVGLAGCRGTVPTQPATPAASLAEFEGRVDALRASAQIPAVSGAIARDGRVAWARGFGVADLATGRAATDTTLYHLASLTKPYASTVLLQLVAEGRISLDDPVSKYGIVLAGPGVVRVRHLMSHTSEGTPGTAYRYNGARFSLLDSVIARADGRPFAEAVAERVLRRIGVTHTAPNPLSPSFAASIASPALVQATLARGYSSDGRAVPTEYPASFSTAAGLVASAVDVARFSIALDRGELLSPAMRALAFAPTVTPAGDTLPYALGWFSTRYRGVRVIWHYGYWTAISALIVKVPDRGLTLVVLANTDALSRPYALGDGRLDGDPWATEFLDAFVLGSAPLP
ncbi:beta-lactamase [Gemmatirosa kalamazoonensis]|uniref:Beta-lactamase n=1 Tax=Gemmatirosa kalamazoonensis TaxID=861299 RepID=W0RFP2_9BACT|nr:serine hydrolase domain-containing protein [Gemmatirosa kalamazoonensis]AHG89924.1 beta-lactamase [Gemmatirosa kalamazoonensis]